MELTQNKNQPPHAAATFTSGLLRLCLLAFLLAVVAGISSGCRSPQEPSTAFKPVDVPIPPKPGDFDYAHTPLHEGDVVSISFQYSTGFNTVQKITLDGNLNLESVGPVKATGKTPAELEAELAKLYHPQIKDDVVTVKLVNASSIIYVSGAVFHPGKVEMDRPLTALEAVMEAGGFDPNRAKLSEVTVVRIENGRQKTFHVNLSRALSGRDPVPFYLKPFDIVDVPSKTFNF